MATQERKGFLFMQLGADWTNDDWEEKWHPIWREYRPDDSEKLVFIGEQPLVCEVPDDFDPRARQIVALEAQKREITAKFQAAVAELNARISKLQAIEFAG